MGSEMCIRDSSLAGRWATKEAVLKCIGEGLQVHALADIEVLTSPSSGAPRLRLHGNALYESLRLGLCRWSISISHDAGIAIAFSSAERLNEAVHSRAKSQ